MVDLATPHPNLLVGTKTFDDAGVFRIREDLAMVQTVDYFTPIVDDPYAFGQIAAANALSDVYAMGGTPTTVLNIVGYPITKLPPDTLAQILKGGKDKVSEAGAVIVGGHSIDDSDPKFGMAVTGFVHPDRVWTNAGARVGDVLVLTKPLGAGVMTTAIKRGAAAPEDIETVTSVMAQLNKIAAEMGHRYDVHACTDVTGFGFLGHALELARASNVHLHVYASQVPILDRAFDFAKLGTVPGGTKRNQAFIEPDVHYASDVDEMVRLLLADSITSGGLLLALSPRDAKSYLAELHAAGITRAAVVAEVTECTDDDKVIIVHR